jgi:hypothetical protein
MASSQPPPSRIIVFPPEAVRTAAGIAMKKATVCRFTGLDTTEFVSMQWPTDSKIGRPNPTLLGQLQRRWRRSLPIIPHGRGAERMVLGLGVLNMSSRPLRSP